MFEKDNSILFLGDVVPYKVFRFKNDFKTVINLECPIVNSGVPVTGKVNLKVNYNYLKTIFRNNLLAVSIGNNHILDYGINGLESTKNELDKIKVKWFGLNSVSGEKYHPLIIEINGAKIAFISTVSKSTSPLTEFNNVVYLDLLNADEIISRITKIRILVQRIVLYIHWGHEESSYPEKEDIRLARRLIEAGVDVVVGSHAHAPQAVERYKNGIIAYNLGNFIMPGMKDIPSYFDKKGIPRSNYYKHIMIWNRISWGLVINMTTLEYKVKKYMFLGNHVIELAYTPMDKYLKLTQYALTDSYELLINKHLRNRALYRKFVDLVNRPHVPLILKRKLWK